MYCRHKIIVPFPLSRDFIYGRSLTSLMQYKLFFVIAIFLLISVAIIWIFNL